MTGKRFNRYNNCIIDNYGIVDDSELYVDTVILSINDVINLMNTLHEENKQLKQQLAFLEEFIKSGVQYEYYQRVYDENIQLKKSIDCQDKTIKEQCIKIDWASECGVKWEKEFKEWKGVA